MRVISERQLAEALEELREAAAELGLGSHCSAV